MTGIASIPPDGLTYHEWLAAMRALNPDTPSFAVPACFVTPNDEDDEYHPPWPEPVVVRTLRVASITLVEPPPFVIDVDDP